MSQTPYTYYLKWTSTGMKYYGVRFAKNCDPTDLWSPYKTSSKYVTRYILDHGDPDIISIRKVFNGDDATVRAQNWENKVLKRLNVIHRGDFLNKTDNKSISIECCAMGAFAAAPSRIGRTKETHPGVKSCADKQRGRTKETHPGLAARGMKLRGRTKENHLGIATQAGKLRGRTKETHSYLVAIGESVSRRQSKEWRIETPTGEIVITNLKKWCEENNFRRGSVGDNIHLRGHRFHLMTREL